MSDKIPLLVRFDGGPSEDRDAITIRGRTDNRGSVSFDIERDKVSWVIAKLAEWNAEAARRAGWQAQPIDQQDDTGLWMRPTQYGLIDGDKPGIVYLVMDVGPLRLRFALPKSDALSLGQTLQACAAPDIHRH